VKEGVYEKIKKLNNGGCCYFNMSEGGGAVCHKCNEMYLLFEIPLYGGDERYIETYFENQINDLVTLAYSWT
jgi:hypothetical protein